MGNVHSRAPEHTFLGNETLRITDGGRVQYLTKPNGRFATFLRLLERSSTKHCVSMEKYFALETVDVLRREREEEEEEGYGSEGDDEYDSADVWRGEEEEEEDDEDEDEDEERPMERNGHSTASLSSNHELQTVLIDSETTTRIRQVVHRENQADINAALTQRSGASTNIRNRSAPTALHFEGTQEEEQASPEDIDSHQSLIHVKNPDLFEIFYLFESLKWVDGMMLKRLQQHVNQSAGSASKQHTPEQLLRQFKGEFSDMLECFDMVSTCLDECEGLLQTAISSKVPVSQEGARPVLELLKKARAKQRSLLDPNDSHSDNDNDNDNDNDK